MFAIDTLSVHWWERFLLKLNRNFSYEESYGKRDPSPAQIRKIFDLKKMLASKCLDQKEQI